MLLIELAPNHPIYMVGHTVLGVFFSRVVFHPMTQSTLNLWWALNLVVLVYNPVDEFAHTRLVECFVAHTFALVSLARCQG